MSLQREAGKSSDKSKVVAWDGPYVLLNGAFVPNEFGEAVRNALMRINLIGAWTGELQGSAGRRRLR
jgi:hypothetical protein